MKAVIAGSFDPFTLGHLELVEETLKVFGNCHILINAQSVSKNYIADAETRQKIIELSCAHLPNVTVEIFKGLLPAKVGHDAVLVRGLRDAADYGYEHGLFDIYNKISDNDIKIVYLMPKKHTATSSSVVRELIKYKSDKYQDFVHPNAAALIFEIYAPKCRHQ